MSQLLTQVLQANIYLQPIQFTLVIVTNILNIRVLCSRTLRSSSCTHYFLAYAVTSTIYTCIVCPTQFLRGFYVDWANTLVGCKISFYMLFLTPFIAKVMLVLASFDRYCSSSKSRRLHSRSTKYTARITIIIFTIISAIYMSPMLVIYYFDKTTSLCVINSNVLVNIYTFSQVILYYISAPILMITFGCLTISNIQQHVIQIASDTMLVRSRRIEKQLARMLILQVSVHLILTTPFGVIYVLNIFDPLTRTPNILAIRYILVIWQQCDYFASFFLYVLSGSIYRKQFLQIFKFINHANSRVHPVVNPQPVAVWNRSTVANNVRSMH